MSQKHISTRPLVERSVYDTPIEQIVNGMAYHAGRVAGAALTERVFRDYDPLTLLLNRRGFDEALEYMLTENPEKTYGLVAIDIGNLKYANTLLGHEGGDHVIVISAAAFRRRGDLAVRLGGDEAAILFELDRRTDNGSHDEQLNAMMDHLRDARTPIVATYPQLDTGAIRLYMGVGATVYDRSLSFAENYKIADTACEADKVTARDTYGEMRGII